MRLKSIVFWALLWSSLGMAQDKVKIAVWGDSRENADGACEGIIRTHPLLPDGKVNHKKGMVHIINGVDGDD